MLRPVLIATAVAGVLDILSAFIFAGMAGVSPMGVLRFVASGPFPATLETPGWALAGLAVHFAIMAGMVVTYFFAAPRIPAMLRHPVAAGLAYGFLLWILMYWLVRPLRWPDMPLPSSAWDIANALFSHCVLVGLPIALTAARWLAPARRNTAPA